MVRLQAHRGVSPDYPENTLAAFRAAAEEGYDLIECDPKYTKDGKFVILHDQTLNRTARRKNGKPLSEPVRIDEITLEEAQNLEYGSWKDPKFKGEQLPLLSDLLNFAEINPISIKFDNVWEKFPEKLQDQFLTEIAARGNQVHIGFTCRRLDALKKVADRLPNADLHYDGEDLSRDTLEQVKEIAKGHHLYIWVCFDNQMTKWFTGSKATPELCALVRQYGELGIWILSEREELHRAIHDFHAQVIETTGHIKPQWLECFE